MTIAMAELTSKDVATIGISSLFSTAMTVIFFVGVGVYLWRAYGGIPGVVSLLAVAIGRVTGEEAGKEIAVEIGKQADEFSGWVADKTIRGLLPPEGVMREAYLRTLYAEEINHMPELIEFLEEIRKGYKPESAEE
ncbi:hypothetical protein [Kordiimonas sp.]|uniref:hypothetical protein n=1 Tax=Kordiimonas sp. TaxID=1970157 RepID=UPI003A95BDA4